MSSNPLIYNSPAQTMMDAFTALLNSGFIKIYTGSQPAVNGAVTGTLLASLTFGATAFGASSASGSTCTATANAIGSATAGNTGTAGYFALVKSDNSTVVATGVVGTSGSDLNFATTTINSGNTVAISAFTITQAQT